MGYFPPEEFGPLPADWFGVPPGWIPTYDPDGVDTPYDVIAILAEEGLPAQNFGFQEAKRVITRKRANIPLADGLVRITSGPKAGSRIAAMLGSVDFVPAPPVEGVAGKLKVSDPLNACSPLVNDLSGMIAVISRGMCPFSTKIQFAADAGAVAAIVHNNYPNEDLIVMAGTRVEIPAAFVGQTNGQTLAAAENAGAVLLQDEKIFEFDSSYGSFQLVVPTIIHDSGNIEGGNAWVEERPAVGWTMREATCLISDIASGVAIESSPTSISLQVGELAVCDFLNLESMIFQSSFEN